MPHDKPALRAYCIPLMSVPLEFANVTKAYGRNRVLDRVSFTLRSGEIAGLIGINGAGKSTLLKAVLDLHGIDAGAITLFSLPHREPAARRNLAYLAEHFNPPYYATGNDVLRLLAGLDGRRIVPARVHDECRALKLDPEVLSAPCRSYSKGMVQKLGLIGCLVDDPALLILDEPMSGLDPLARHLVKQRLLKQRDAGCSIFFSTHLLEDVQSICDRVLVLHGGTIVHSGPVDSLLSKTASDTLEQGFLAILKSADTV